MSKFVRYKGADQDQVAWGSNDDPRTLLTVGKTYEVLREEVHSWHTKITLKDFPGKRFNSVCFEASEVK